MRWCTAKLTNIRYALIESLYTTSVISETESQNWKKMFDFLYALASLDFTLVGIHYKCARSADRMTFGGIIQTDHASVQADQCWLCKY